MRLILSKYKVQMICAVLLVLWAGFVGFTVAMLQYHSKVNALKLELAQQNALREQQYAHNLQYILKGCQR